MDWPILFMIGYALFGIAMIRTETLPRGVRRPSRGLRSGPTAGFGIAQLVSTAA
jgi:hypothetical protein